MRFTDILFCAIQAAGVLSAPHAGNEGEAPDFANSSVPPPNTPWLSFTDKASPLDKRACWSGSPYGCDLGKKRCWKVCGDGGQWCWTAGGDGSGAWNGCTDWGSCSQQQSCGKNCNNPKECDCSC
ncbi:hypothetical protein AA0113_g6740 [Alternaria arborescens]|uniref:Uncharacterized protein n=1 Tax=Alternaria arborescens TaxID=156630 RepID=A0A4Q4RWD5_9PLEO|nr:hypothetical protein AA0111_g1290 [Alternaria arborescens]RYN41370.1 hypothetical protein AA0112_g2378 [Alternaria arborescens]RYO40978.1 hypothetical protein AA0111_g1290 [Alternaria arborescens]RYO61571.1 hypothetical protein AA0113_g6740 [Alternaria arborescens]